MRQFAQTGQQYVFTHLGSRQGLASDEVMGVQQDKKGFIWIATLNGVQRYDGHRFLTFRHLAGNPNSIPDNKIFKILLDKKDRLWLVSSQNRLGYLNVSDFSFHEIPLRIDNAVLQSTEANLFEDNYGNIMLILSRVGILTYNETSREFSLLHTPFQLPRNWKPLTLYQDKVKNDYWLACDSGLAKFNPQNKQLSYRNNNTDGDEIIKAFWDIRFVAHPYLDKQGRFWIYSWNPSDAGPFIYSYDAAKKIKKEWESNLKLAIYHELHNIYEHEDGTIWFTGVNLFAELPSGNQDFELVANNLPGEFSIRYDVVRHLFQDRENNLWVSTDKGLFRFNPDAQLFQAIPNRRQGSNKIYPNEVTDILQMKGGEIMVTTWGEGNFIYDTNLKPIRSAFSLQGQRMREGLIWACLQRSNGDIWRCSQDGLVFITPNGTQKTLLVDVPIAEHSTIRQIVEDKNGNIWLGSHRGHIIKWNAATNTFSLVHKFTTINRLYVDRPGTIWACTGGNGVIHIDPASGRILANYTLNAADGKRLMGLAAADIIQYDDSTYIIASEGLNLLNIKTGNIRFFTSENGLPSNSVNNVILDRQRYLWATTDGQLCRIRLERSVTTVFSEEDGLPASSFNVASANLLNDGRIALGRAHDFIMFDPAKIIARDPPISPVEITGFSLMNSWLSVDSLQKLREVSLRYNRNSVIIEFSTLAYLNQFAISYMMEGLDKTWISAGQNNQAIYNYLPPGNYTFKIKSNNGEGQESGITSLPISVRTPFWKTWWFYSILALLAAAFFFWKDKEQIRRKTALQKMRSDIAGNLHEEINIALNNINVLSEIARIKADKEPEQSKTYITEIHRKSHNMIIAMDDMLWSIDPANDSMNKAIARIKEFAASLRSRHEVGIDLYTDEKVASLSPDMKLRHEIMIIYQLALRMLIEEMNARQTNIHLDYIKSQLQLNIFSKQVRLGDNNNNIIKTIEEMRLRAASIGATFEIHSDEKGTAIVLAVRIAN